MKKTVLFFALTLIVKISFAQVQDPVKWTFTAKKLKDGKYEVHLTATIESGWHIYSQTTPDGGPVPTAVTFSKNPLVELDGKVKEVGKLEKKYEKIFEVDVKQFSNKVVFVQAAKVKGNVKTAVAGDVEFMVCDDTQCLPPKKVKFSVSLN